MKIKEFFKNCIYCRHVWFDIERAYSPVKVRKDEMREIYTREDFNKFINDYGDEEFVEWSFENSEDDAIITFHLKMLIDKE